MRREYQAYLNDILESLKRIQRYTGNMTYNDFIKDELVQDGVLRNLEIVGEAIKKIPDEIKNIKPQIEWRKIAGLRDILVHGYFGIDLEIVWDVVKNKIPGLKQEIEELTYKKK